MVRESIPYIETWAFSAIKYWTRLTYNCAHLRLTKESLTFEYLEKENILQRRRNIGKEKNKNIWRRKVYFLQRKRKRREENIWLKKICFFCWGEEKQRRNRRKCLEKENILFTEELLEHWLWKHWQSRDGEMKLPVWYPLRKYMICIMESRI